ncbi:tripartite tricarboxylate transporter TctB family protein [Stieleria varia]|uniref:Double zinc ribbon n=1 Tax=Stieleria varia TaxID=2528005 RepID=A0A5C6A347_9BACT|nr:tripartite tricarboxylate transporter TctB family protein [Stieleria varia]TWT93757.1 hypothetical protein Pla52n_55850 [Stieleria varia]
MPIQIKCSCGKSLAVQDQFAGRKVKCPGCGQPVQVPGSPQAGSPQTSSQPNPKPAPGSQQQAYAQAPQAQPLQAQAPQQAPAYGGLDDLFDEAGFQRNVTSVCPACNEPMPPEAALCVKCGFNKLTGQTVQRHMTVGVDIDPSEMVLRKAEQDMKDADRMQRNMTENAGMPWWMLGLILFVLGSATTVAVLAVNAANRVENVGFDPMSMFLQLAGAACSLVAIGATIKLIFDGFQESPKTGLLCLTIVYLFVFTFQKPKGRIGALIVAVVMGGIAGGLFAASNR